MKKFDEWNETIKVGYKNRDIFYIKMGHNIGYEQDGKGNDFVRPVVVLKGFNKEVFWGIPLSSKDKEGKFYYRFEFEKDNSMVKNIAILSQIRLFSTKRLLNKIGMISESDFEKLKDKLRELID